MPTTEDRIVQMRFENKDFDKNIEASKKSFEQFEKVLTMNDGEKGLKNLNKALNDLDTTEATKGLQNVTEKLSALQTVASGALLSIGYKLENLLSTGIKSLTIDQLGAGWSKYASITSSTQTIMSATRTEFEDTGKQMEYVNEQLDRLNTFTDETSYNLTEMTNNIGKFTSQGVKLDTAVTAMQGIATWAAMSGANSEQASRAMYNLSQALATGSVKLIDWRSIENANMATVEFKQTVLDTAASLGTLKKSTDGTYKTLDGAAVSVSNFNAELQKGWFSSEVLLKSLDKYGGFSSRLTKYISALDITAKQFLGMIDGLNAGILEQNDDYKELSKTIPSLKKYIEDLASSEYELGRTAFKAAQEAKTFEEAINATKDAVSTGWMKTFQLLFGDYEKAKGLWTTVAEELYDLFAESANERNRLLTLWKENGGYEDLMEGLRSLWEFIKSIKDAFAEAWEVIFPKAKAKDLLILTKRFRAWAESLKENEGVLKAARDAATLLATALKFLLNIVKGLRLFLTPIIQQLKIFIQNVSGFISNIANGVSSLLGFADGLEAIRFAFLFLGWAVSIPIKLINNFIDWIKKLSTKTLPEIEVIFKAYGTRFKTAFKHFIDSFKILGKNISSGFAIGILSGIGAIFDAAFSVADGVIGIFKEVFKIHSPSKVMFLIGGMIIAGLVAGIVAFWPQISNLLSPLGGLIAKVGDIVTIVINAASTALEKIKPHLQKFIEQIFDTENGLKNLATAILLVASAIAVLKTASAIATMAKNIASALTNLTGAVASMFRAFDSIGKFITNYSNILLKKEQNKLIADVVNSIGKIAIQLAISLGIVTAAVIALSKIDLPNLKQAAIILASIVGSFVVIVGLLLILNKVFSSGGTSSALTIVGKQGSVFDKFGAAVQKTSSQTNTAALSIKNLATSIMLIAMSVSFVILSLKSLVKAINSGGKVSYSDVRAILFDVMLGLIGILITMQLFAKQAEKNDGKARSAIKMIIKLISSVIAMTLALSRLAKVIGKIFSLENGERAVIASFLYIIGILGVLTLIFKVLENSKDGYNLKVIFGFIILVGAVIALILNLTILLSIISIFKINDDAIGVLGTVIGITAILVLMCVALVAILSKISFEGILSSLSIIALIGAFIISCFSFIQAVSLIKELNISNNDIEIFKKLVTILTIVISVMALISGILAYATGGVGVLAVVAIAGLVLALAFSVKIFAEALEPLAKNLSIFSNFLIEFKERSKEILLSGLSLLAFAAELLAISYLLGLASIPMLLSAAAMGLFVVAAKALAYSSDIIYNNADKISRAFSVLSTELVKVWDFFFPLLGLGFALAVLGAFGLYAAVGIAALSGAMALFHVTIAYFKEFFDMVANFDFESISSGIWDFSLSLAILGVVSSIGGWGLLIAGLGLLSFSAGLAAASKASDVASASGDKLRVIFSQLSEMMTGLLPGAIAIGLAGIFIGAGFGAAGFGVLAFSLAIGILAGTLALIGLALNYLNDVITNVKNTNPELITHVEIILNLLVSAFTLLISISEALTNALIPCIKLFTDMFTFIEHITSDVLVFVNDVWDYIVSFGNKVKDYSKNIVDGLFGGIASYFSNTAIGRWVNNTFGLIPEAVEDEYDIRSPSHVMYDIGEMTALGFVDGMVDTIDSETDRIRYAAWAAAKAAREAAEEGFDESYEYDENVDVAENYKNKYRQNKKNKDLQNERATRFAQKDITLKELGAQLGSSIKENWDKFTKGEIGIASAISNVFGSLKDSGGKFLSQKFSDLKNSLLGEGGLLSGFKDLFTGENNPFSGLFENIGDLGDFDPQKFIDDVTSKIDLSNFNGTDLSGIGSATSPSSYSTSNNYTFTQNNYSPKPLSRIELYRQTNRQFNNFKMREVLAK